LEGKRIDGNEFGEYEKKENESCDADYHPVVSGRNKIGHIFQLMGIMKEKGKVTSESMRQEQEGFEQEELRGYVRREIPQSEVIISDMKYIGYGENWMGKGHRRSLGIDQRQGNKKFLIVPIESRLEAKRSLFLSRCLN